MGEACRADALIGVLLKKASLSLLHCLLFGCCYAVVFTLAFGCEEQGSLPPAWGLIPGNLSLGPRAGPVRHTVC